MVQKQVLEYSSKKSFETLSRSLEGKTQRQEIDETFSEFIDGLLDPIKTHFQESTADLNPEEVNLYLESLAEQSLPDALDLIADLARSKGIDQLTLQTWFGPQSVGKGALGDTIQWLYKLRNLPEAEKTAFLDTIKTKYNLTDDDINAIQTDSVLLEQLDPTLMSIFQTMVSDRSDIVKTGTGGIFAPTLVTPVDPRYAPYTKQSDITKVLVDAGIMVDSSWTNLLTLIEIARSIAYGASLIDADVWPRTAEQFLFLSKVTDTLAVRGLSLEHVPLHIEPYDDLTARLIRDNPDIAIRVYTRIGKQIRLISREPEIFGIDPNDLDLFSKLGVDPKDKATMQARNEEIRTTGSTTARNLAENVAQVLNTSLVDLKNSIFNEIREGITRGITTLMGRVANRIQTQGRPDDLKLGVYLRRLGTYYSETGIVPLTVGARTLPAGGDYVEAIGFQLRALILNLNPDYKFEKNTTYQKFEELVRRLYLIRVSK